MSAKPTLAYGRRIYDREATRLATLRPTVDLNRVTIVEQRIARPKLNGLHRCPYVLRLQRRQLADLEPKRPELGDRSADTPSPLGRSVKPSFREFELYEAAIGDLTRAVE